MTFGNKVSTHRLKNNLTQGELGEKVGVSAMMISYLEKGLKQPTFEMAKRLAKALDVSLDYLADDSKN